MLAPPQTMCINNSLPYTSAFGLSSKVSCRRQMQHPDTPISALSKRCLAPRYREINSFQSHCHARRNLGFTPKGDAPVPSYAQKRGTAKQRTNPAEVSRIPRWSAWLSSASHYVRQEIAQQDLDNQYFKEFPEPPIQFSNRMPGTASPPVAGY